LIKVKRLATSDIRVESVDQVLEFLEDVTALHRLIIIHRQVANLLVLEVINVPGIELDGVSYLLNSSLLIQLGFVVWDQKLNVVS